MGAKDMERQKLNVFRMRLLGAQVRAVTSGTATLKDATSEAIRDWVTNVETTHYILGSAAGPHPYPMMVGTLHCHTLHSRVSRFPPLPHCGGYPALCHTACWDPTPTPRHWVPFVITLACQQGPSLRSLSCSVISCILGSVVEIHPHIITSASLHCHTTVILAALLGSTLTLGLHIKVPLSCIVHTLHFRSVKALPPTL